MFKQLQISLAKTISIIFNAPLIAVFTFIIIHKYVGESTFKHLITASFFSGILPVVIIYWMVRGKIVSDMLVNERIDRFKPFLGAITSYSLGVISMVLLKAPLDMFYLMACYVVNSCVMMLISRKWKISVHASGISGPATFLVHQYGASVWPFLILSFIICWARWRLNMHTYNQLIAGLVLTAFLTYVQLEFYIGFTPQL